MDGFSPYFTQFDIILLFLYEQHKNSMETFFWGIYFNIF
jgi:hypothetical protein